MDRNIPRPKIARALRKTILIPKLIAAIFRPSLSRVVNEIVTIHLNGSKQAQAYHYPFLKRLVAAIGRNPVRSMIAIAVLYGSAIWLGESSHVPQLELQKETIDDFGTVNVGILGVQAALIGLVFPLVIAFVGLLNQSRASFATRLTIYVESTAAVFTGISSLLLCFAIAIRLAFASQLGSNAMLASTVLNLLWFAANVGALSYFVLRTIEYMHPARRTPLIRAYVSNVVWPRELREIVTRNRWDGAIDYGYLPKGTEDPDIFEPGRGARTWYGLVDYGEPRVMRQLWRKKRLVNVRFAMLSPIVQNWLADAGELTGETRHDFVIPVEPGQEYEGELPLVRATTALGPISALGIWCSFTFRTVRKDHGAITSSSDLLREMMADLIALVDGRQVEEFTTQLREVLDFHLFLYQLAQSPVEDFNYALIGPGRGLFGYSRTLGPNWVHAYRDLIARAAERLFDEPGFFGRLAHAPATIYGRAGATVTPKALRPLIDFADHLVYRLMERELDGKETATTAREVDAPTPPLTRREEILDEAWRDLAAGWEGLLQEIAVRSARDEQADWDWDDFQRIAENVVEHLRLTTEMVGRAVWQACPMATRWTCDLLLHWRHQAQRAWDIRGTYWLLQSEGLTLSAIDRPWDEVTALPLGPDGQALTPAGIFSAVVHNAWLDHLVTMASLSLHWAIHSAARETPIMTARMLLQDEPHDSGDIGYRGPQPLSGVEILASVLRVRGAEARYADRSYAGRFDHLLEGLGDLGKRPSVSMRIYSSHGGLSFDALPLAHVLAIMATSNGPQALDRSLRRQLTQSDDEALLRRKGYLEALSKAAGEIDEDEPRALLDAICDLGAVPFEARLAHTRQLLSEALTVLAEHRENAIAEAEIDPGRIRAVTLAAAANAFKSTRFPLQFFAAIEGTDDELEAFTLNAQGQDKGSYTDPPMGNIVVNEDEWWRDVMSERVASIVWSDALKGAKFQQLEGRTPEEFWRAVRDGSARMREAGNNPVLVIASTAHPKWLNDWRWPYGPDVVAKPGDLVITEALGQAEGYAFSMNDTPVFEAPSLFGQAFLFPAQLLAKLRYHDYGDGVPLSLEFQESEGDRWKGTMSATFQRSVELADLEGYRIRFATDESNPENSGEP